MKMTKNSAFYALQVNQNTPRAEVKKIYRKLALRYHPDKNPNNAIAEEIFKAMANAYAIVHESGKYLSASPSKDAEFKAFLDDLIDRFDRGESEKESAADPEDKDKYHDVYEEEKTTKQQQDDDLARARKIWEDANKDALPAIIHMGKMFAGYGHLTVKVVNLWVHLLARVAKYKAKQLGRKINIANKKRIYNNAQKAIAKAEKGQVAAAKRAEKKAKQNLDDAQDGAKIGREKDKVAWKKRHEEFDLPTIESIQKISRLANFERIRAGKHSKKATKMYSESAKINVKIGAQRAGVQIKNFIEKQIEKMTGKE
jgi:curved DNA-binding protein CbpA